MILMKQQKPFIIVDDVHLPWMSDSSMVSPIHKLIAHGIGKVICPSSQYFPKNYTGCILILEYSYFYLQSDEQDPIHVFASAVKQYQSSGTQAAICKALKKAIQVHRDNKDKLQQAIIDIILDSRMCEQIT